MTRAYPFVRPPHGLVRPEVWALDVSDGSIPLPDVLPDWDYNTTLDLHRTVAVDGARIRTAVGLAASTPLALSVRWTASGSLLRGLAGSIEVPSEDDRSLEIAFSLPGGDLGGTLTLETVIATTVRTEGAERAPRRPGSILWSDPYDVRLQGDAPLFPLAVADFRELAYPDGAAWYLQIDQDVDAAAMGSMLLLVNSANDLLVRALAEAANPGPDAAAVLSTLSTQVATTLVEQALATDGFQPDHEYEPRSLGAMFVGLLNQLGLDDWESLQREHRSEPALFTARMQAATKLWQGLT